MRHLGWFVFMLAISSLGLTAPTRAQQEEAERLKEATQVLKELKDAPDVSVPRWVVDKAVALAVFPSVKKGGLVVGGHFGRGVLSAKSARSGTWSSPSFLTLTGGSLGLQIGGQAVDLVLVVIDQRGLEQLLNNQFKIGDLQMRAKILSYSRTRGLFAGITLKGSTIRQDRDANERFYGRAYRSSELVIDRLGGAPDPVPAWRDELTRTIQ